MRASWGGALGRLPAAQAGQRQRRRAEAPDRRTFHCLALSRLAPDDGDAARGGRVCEPEARPAADASDGDRGARAAAENEQARARPQDLSLSPAQSDDRAREPRLGCRHHLYSDRARLSLSRGDHRLGIARGAWVAAVEHDGRFVLSGGARGGAGEVRKPEIFNTDQARSSLRPPSPARSPTRASRSPWTAEAAGWTTCSSSGSGGRSSTRTSISRATPMAAKPRAASLSGSLSTMIDARTRRWQTVCRWRSGARRSSAPGLWT